MLSITINPGQLERARQLMSPKQLNMALKSATTAAAKKVRTETRKVVQQEIKIKTTEFADTVKIIHESHGDGKHSATVRVSHKPIPLKDFSGVRMNKQRGVIANVWKKRPPQRMPWAFKATMRSGHTGFFARQNQGKSRKIRKIHGPTIHGQVEQARVSRAIVEAAQKTFNERFLSQFKRFGLAA